MSSFTQILDEIIYVSKRDEEELRRALRAFNHSPYGKHVKAHIMEYLKSKGVQYGIFQNKSLNQIPPNYSSFHEDEYGQHHIHTH